uniref:Uncharacterized protein n=1 Tax=Timema genevievae TaxID=629358 RepID=A0A7R9K1U8_TIMGE|nr:unnamed protein product [Timema genevievae]
MTRASCDMPSQRNHAQCEMFSSSPERDSYLDLPILGGLAQHKTSALANYATEAFAWRDTGKPFRKNHPSSPERDSYLDLPILGGLAQHKTSALANYATEAGWVAIIWAQRSPPTADGFVEGGCLYHGTSYLTMPEKLFKVIIIGDPTVGKTSFVQRPRKIYLDDKGILQRFSRCDLAHRQIDQMQIETFYKEHNFIGWTETSAKEGLMVNDSMKFLVDVMMRQEGIHGVGPLSSDSLKLSGPASPQEKKSCLC